MTRWKPVPATHADSPTIASPSAPELEDRSADQFLMLGFSAAFAAGVAMTLHEISVHPTLPSPRFPRVM
ncbi:hypothetical protein BO99DRAFT_399023 [Aspergillus violaceofuscus CBS 115571]|uniref:Uncharacterized protein n=1 Tax=Aspergillus violaceofuscus (strain CBS 115571) TaxID=1450538 RepID=A0A2V5I4Q8_ASPV1|nr:hypothetical protein BO99DRAFT_399023 [Aspergillus violaceofuscus CBS 115571]